MWYVCDVEKCQLRSFLTRTHSHCCFVRYKKNRRADVLHFSPALSSAVGGGIGGTVPGLFDGLMVARANHRGVVSTTGSLLFFDRTDDKLSIVPSQCLSSSSTASSHNNNNGFWNQQQLYLREVLYKWIWITSHLRWSEGCKAAADRNK